MNQSIQTAIVSRIYSRGRGWAFSQTDFSDLGSRSSIDVALHRLMVKGTIRRVFRGIYDYPRYGLGVEWALGPDLDQVAHALARKFGWRIQVTGPAALNLLGLSTQVMGRVAYLSDGPSRRYTIGQQELTFVRTALKESGLRHQESSLLVQGLKALGRERITQETIQKLRDLFDAETKQRMLKDTTRVTGWIREAILKICGGKV